MIEINATFYRLQKPSTFAGWRDQTPDDFVFAVKAPRYATIRQTLAEAGPAVQRFVESGLAELGAKLGPLLWQFAPTKRYDRDEIEAFLALLPKEIGARRARHVLSRDTKASDQRDSWISFAGMARRPCSPTPMSTRRSPM